MNRLKEKLSVREIKISDIEYLLQYWYNLSEKQLERMGATKSLMPAYEDFYENIYAQIQLPYDQKQTYVIIWLYEKRAIGHCNVNKIIYGKEAYMHLHLWKENRRQKGSGSILVKKSIPYFFKNLQLDNLFCEPFAQNPAPNRLLQKIGFDFEKEYVTKPGSINYEQSVRRYAMSRKQCEELLLIS
ncbi:GNAT family N-acetyltransferase [Flavobacteriaceae bacterium M23B6Z8]